MLAESLDFGVAAVGAVVLRKRTGEAPPVPRRKMEGKSSAERIAVSAPAERTPPANAKQNNVAEKTVAGPRRSVDRIVALL
jgi:hypothetical protein